MVKYKLLFEELETLKGYMDNFNKAYKATVDDNQFIVHLPEYANQVLDYIKILHDSWFKEEIDRKNKEDVMNAIKAIGKLLKENNNEQ